MPVAWYLLLQLFGNNNFSLTLLYKIPEECKQFSEILIVSKKDSLSLVETSYMNQMVSSIEKRKVNMVYDSLIFFNCINQQDADLVLVSDRGLWGSYKLSRKGIDQLLTELDILTLQQSYGKEISR